MEKNILDLAKRIYKIYDEIDPFDIRDATQDLDNVSDEFLDNCYKILLSEEKINIVNQLLEYKEQLDLNQELSKEIDDVVSEIHELNKSKTIDIISKLENFKKESNDINKNDSQNKENNIQR